jgi:hypothetical protein
MVWCAEARCDTPQAAVKLPVELELILAVDASGSVSAAEFNLQVEGLAVAFRDPEVIRAIGNAGSIAVAVMQWSSPGQQVLAVDWKVLSDAASAEAMAREIEAAGRVIMGETALDAAIRFATAELESNAFLGRRRVIDVSGDGATNWGGNPDQARDRAVAAGITINGLAIINEQPELGSYYRERVIGGPGAFVMMAADYDDFARAMRLKLIEEIGPRPAAARREPEHDAHALHIDMEGPTRIGFTGGAMQWKVGVTARP